MSQNVISIMNGMNVHDCAWQFCKDLTGHIRNLKQPCKCMFDTRHPGSWAEARPLGFILSKPAEVPLLAKHTAPAVLQNASAMQSGCKKLCFWHCPSFTDFCQCWFNISLGHAMVLHYNPEVC